MSLEEFKETYAEHFTLTSDEEIEWYYSVVKDQL
jgi:hypothetical protein